MSALALPQRHHDAGHTHPALDLPDDPRPLPAPVSSPPDGALSGWRREVVGEVLTMCSLGALGWLLLLLAYVRS